MNLRLANKNDVPEILNVLKASLGETSSKKTEEVWNYKHVNNPFGKSLVLVAEEANTIVGVRAFMRWQWNLGDSKFSAFRAVDTATHPAHQGKGIFKKLTLKALDIAKESGDDFIFNTPNPQSKPGYLKMGWNEISNLKVNIIPVSPLFWKRNHPPHKNERISIEEGYEFYNGFQKKSGNLFTPKTTDFLSWRYENNPLQPYLIVSKKDYYIAGYVKKHKYVRELRISEILFRNTEIKDIRNQIFTWAYKNRVHFISFSEGLVEKKIKVAIKGKFGPVLTLKNLNLNDENAKFLSKINNWNYSLGDLELF